MKKLFEKSILFILLTCLAGSLLTPFIKKNKYWGNKEYEWKLNNYRKEKYNTVHFGTSRIYRGIDPLLFDSLVNLNSKQKIKSFNLATHAAWANETFYLYDEFLKDSSLSSEVELVFMEFQNIMSVRPEKLTSSKIIYYQNLEHFWFMCKYSIQEVIRDPKKIFTSIYSVGAFSIVSFINFTNLKVINLKMGTKEPMEIESINKRGYLEFPELQKDSTKDIPDQVIRSFTDNIKQHLDTAPNNYNPVFYKKMMDLIHRSKQQQIRLIFILPPVRLTNGMMSVFNALPDENKIQICDPIKYPNLYNPANWIDHLHLNKNGAQELTRQMARLGEHKINQQINL